MVVAVNSITTLEGIVDTHVIGKPTPDLNPT
jgi:hypothetical protein